MSEESSLTGKVSGKKLFVIGTASIVGPWLILTSQWIGYTGASVALAFLICGLLCIPIALCYGELSGMFKDKGGTYEYVKAAYGREAGYWISWTTMFSYIVVTLFQIICVTMLLEYLGGWDFSQSLVMALAIVIMIAMTALNTRDLSMVTSLQVILFVLLVVVGFMYVIIFFFNDAFDTSNWDPFFQEGAIGYNSIIGMDAGFVLAVAALVTMFFGFELIPQFASEAEYPRNKYWKLMVGGIAFVIVFDSLICLAESGMDSLDPSMTTFEYISSLYESNGMVSAVFAEAYVGSWLKWAIAIANFCCMGCCLIGFWMGAARILYSMGKSGSLPSFFAKTNKHGMPSTGNYFMLLMVFILTVIALSGDSWINATFSLMALGVGFTYLGVSLSYLKLKKTMPDAERPWLAPGGKVTGAIAVASSLFMAAMMVYTVIKSAVDGDPTMLIMVIVFFAVIGVIRYLLKVDEKNHPERYASQSTEIQTPAEE
jgi:amino acid transporter